MIFVTVGSELGFERLCRTVDEWAGASGHAVFAQIGPGEWQPQHMKWSRFLARDEFRRRVAASDLVIAHAGMGTILTASEFGKPVLVMPRREHLHETRSDHQVDTARHLAQLGRVHAVEDERALREQLERLDEVVTSGRDGQGSLDGLLDAIRRFAAADPRATPDDAA